MNNLVFYNKDGEVRTELQECTVVQGESDERLTRYKVKDKPCHLQVHFLDDIGEEELMFFYYRITNHGLVHLDKDIATTVKEDFEINPTMYGSTFEIRCDGKFKEAFECAVEIVNDFPDGDDGIPRVGVIISDQPSEAFKKAKEKRKLLSAENTLDNEGV